MYLIIFWPKVLQKEYNGTCNAKHPFFGFCVSTLKGRAVIESVEKRKGNKQLAAFSPKIFSFPKIDGKKSKPTIAAWVIWESFFMLSAALPPCAERCFACAALTARSMHLFPFICIHLSFHKSRMLPSGSINITYNLVQCWKFSSVTRWSFAASPYILKRFLKRFYCKKCITTLHFYCFDLALYILLRFWATLFQYVCARSQQQNSAWFCVKLSTSNSTLFNLFPFICILLSFH